MPLALWVAAGAFAAALVAVLAALAPGGLRYLAAAGVALCLVSAVLAAETPLGIGNGIVPDVRDRHVCDAYRVLEERGLRWRSSGGPVRQRTPPGDCVERADNALDEGDTVGEQDPPPGTDLGEGGVVRLGPDCRLLGCGSG